MKKILIASILAAGFAGSAMATGPANTAIAGVAVATSAKAGNGGTSHSTAGAFALATGDTSANSRLGSLSVTVPDCNVPTTSTVFGQVTTVSGTAQTMGGSYAKNVSTGNGSGTAAAGSLAYSEVNRSLNGVSGSANTTTATWATAGTNQSRSAFASQEASFEAKGATGIEFITVPGYRGHDKIVSIGFGSNATGESDVAKSHQVYSLGQSHCGSGCNTGPGVPFVAGSYTDGNASTFAIVGGAY